MPKLRNLALFGLMVIGACAVPPDTSHMITEDKTVHQARTAMLGMSEADVRMCAGFPTMGITVSNNQKIWTYQRSYSRGSLNVGMTWLGIGPVPGVTGATAVGAEGFCNTQVRFVDGKVVQIEFAGDNNTATHINGLCVSTVDACVADALGSQAPVKPKP